MTAQRAFTRVQRTEEEVRGVFIYRPVLPYCITTDKLLRSTELLFPHPSKAIFFWLVCHLKMTTQTSLSFICIFLVVKKWSKTEAGGMNEWLKALVALPDNLGSVPRINTVGPNLLWLQIRGSAALFWFLRTSYVCSELRHTQEKKKPHTHIIKTKLCLRKTSCKRFKQKLIRSWL